MPTTRSSNSTRQIDVHYLDWNPEATGYPKHTIALNKQVQVILAMVSGGPYPEDVESRIRSRVAVMAALGTAGYRSEDEDANRVCNSQLAHSRSFAMIRHSLTEDGSSRLVLPYEWFTRRIHHPESPQSITPRSNHVLVLWLRDDMFTDEPLYRLNKLIGYVRRTDRITSLRFPSWGRTLRQLCERSSLSTSGTLIRPPTMWLL